MDSEIKGILVTALEDLIDQAPIGEVRQLRQRLLNDVDKIYPIFGWLYEKRMELELKLPNREQDFKAVERSMKYYFRSFICLIENSGLRNRNKDMLNESAVPSSERREYTDSLLSACRTIRVKLEGKSLHGLGIRLDNNGTTLKAIIEFESELKSVARGSYSSAFVSQVNVQNGTQDPSSLRTQVIRATANACYGDMGVRCPPSKMKGLVSVILNEEISGETVKQSLRDFI